MLTLRLGIVSARQSAMDACLHLSFPWKRVDSKATPIHFALFFLIVPTGDSLHRTASHRT